MSEEVIPILYSTLVRQHLVLPLFLGFCVKGGDGYVRKVQSGTMKMVKGLEHLRCKES